MGKLISIIVPVYKVEKWLNRCIESLVNQTYDNMEIILVDDGSPDNCPHLCDIWREKDRRISVIHKANGGLSDARNCGLQKATGEYVLFVDSDDYLNAEAVERLEGYADDADMIVGEATVYDDGKVIHRIHTNLDEKCVYTGTEIACLAVKKGEWYAEACLNMYRTDFLKKNDLYFTYGIFHEDTDFQPRLFLAANKVKYLHYEFYNYVLRSDSICGTPNIKNKTDLFEIYERWACLTEKIQEEKVKKAFAGALCKYFLYTCREFKDDKSEYPKGINGKYLLNNSLNVKEYFKSLFFILFRKIYVRL